MRCCFAVGECASRAATGFEPPAFPIDEMSIGDLQDGMKKSGFTAEQIVHLYLERIEQLDRQGPALRSVIEVNPDASSIARTLDRERKTKGARGPMHGISILLKDNIDTADKMQTTAGSLSLTDQPAKRDAFLVERLRAAGAVVLGKTNLSEWANFRSTHSTSGWSGRGGQTRNRIRAIEIRAVRAPVRLWLFRPTFAASRLELRPMARSSVLLPSAELSGSNPRSALSAAQELFRSLTARILPARWADP